MIDSAAAASLSSAITATPKHRTKPPTPIPFPLNSPPKFPNQSGSHRHHHSHYPEGEVVQNHRPHKISRTANTSHVHESTPPQLMMVKHVNRTPTAFIADSQETSDSAVMSFHGPIGSGGSYEKMETRHCLADQFPTVSLFKDYQNAVMAVILKRIKHCKEFSPALVTGQLLGLDMDSVLEVTNCFPFPIRKEDEEIEAEGANYQLEMMRCLREVNVDNNTVGCRN